MQVLFKFKLPCDKQGYIIYYLLFLVLNYSNRIDGSNWHMLNNKTRAYLFARFQAFELYI